MIPNSIAASGVLWSAIQMIFCALLSYFSLVIVVLAYFLNGNKFTSPQVKCAKKIQVYSYQDLALKTYGNWCRQLVNITSFFANWGSAILYLKLVRIVPINFPNYFYEQTVELFCVVSSIVGGQYMPNWLSKSIKNFYE